MICQTRAPSGGLSQKVEAPIQPSQGQIHGPQHGNSSHNLLQGIDFGPQGQTQRYKQFQGELTGPTIQHQPFATELLLLWKLKPLQSPEESTQHPLRHLWGSCLAKAPCTEGQNLLLARIMSADVLDTQWHLRWHWVTVFRWQSEPGVAHGKPGTGAPVPQYPLQLLHRASSMGDSPAQEGQSSQVCTPGRYHSFKSSLIKHGVL